MANEQIKNYIHGKGLKFWQVAEAIGMNDANFSRRLRHELPQEDAERIRKIVDGLAGGEGND